MKKDDLQKGQFVAVTLTDKGLHSFAYLRDTVPNSRHIYYIHDVATGCVTGATMLLGQFLCEFEQVPDSLELIPGDTNRLYFPDDKGGSDTRVRSYDFLTQDEITETKTRLESLIGNHPLYSERIKSLIALVPMTNMTT